MNRAHSLDALRGYAIVTMVLASAVFSQVLPPWMSHIQTPPPGHVFRPDIAGISWVDLVFPFFLFSMGASMPFSVGRKMDKGMQRAPLCAKAVLRGLKLAFFAIFLQHMYPPGHASWSHPSMWLMPLLAFAALFMMFGKFPYALAKGNKLAIEVCGTVMAVVLLAASERVYGRPFSLYRSNIIILVMANMSVFATLAYIATYRKNPVWRLLPLPFVLAILYHGKEGWQAWICDATPAEWLYRFAFLKYLCIVLPGTMAGDLLRHSLRPSGNGPWRAGVPRWRATWLWTLSVGIIVSNLWGLYTRHLTANLLLSAALSAAILYTVWQQDNPYWKRLATFSALWLMLGLFVEPLEGGIKKDPSNISYYFVATALACHALTAFDVMCDVWKQRFLTSPLVMAGQNPMLAYVTTALLVNPALQITGLYDVMEGMASSPWLAFLRGIIVTGMTVAVAMGFSRIKWFWRT